MIFDYWSPTDFKFAGIDVSTNKIVIGHRDATGWHYDTQGAMQGGLAPNTFYEMLVAVNGLVVSVIVNGVQVLRSSCRRRSINGVAQSASTWASSASARTTRQGVFDDISSPRSCRRCRSSRTPTASGHRYRRTTSPATDRRLDRVLRRSTTSCSEARARCHLASSSRGSPPTPDAYVEWETVIKAAGGLGGLVSTTTRRTTTSTSRSIRAPVRSRSGICGRAYCVNDFTMTVTIAQAGIDQKVTLALSGTGR